MFVEYFHRKFIKNSYILIQEPITVIFHYFFYFKTIPPPTFLNSENFLFNNMGVAKIPEVLFKESLF